MANLTIDLTGTAVNYAEADRVFRIFKANQHIDLGTPVYAKSIKVYLISGGITTLLKENADYVIVQADIDACDNAKSSAKLMDPNWDETLTSGITSKLGVTTDESYTISISYQRLYPNQLRTAYYHNEPLNLTPELLLSMVKDIENLKTATSRVVDIATLSNDHSVLFELDESKTNTNNYVEGEVHTVNTSAGKYLIHPKGGSFYGDSVTVKYYGNTLVEGKDYQLAGMNIEKTKNTSHTAPVYDFIMLLTDVNGDFEISYHAFGGDPTLDNYRELLDKLTAVTDYLNDESTLTVANLGNTDIMTSLYERVTTLENNMRRLQGTPSYGDITNGKAITLKLYADTTCIHWYNIAKLYTTMGTAVSPCTADTFEFRLQSLLTHFQFHVAVSVDLSNRANDILNVEVIAENYPRGYQPFTDYADIDKIIRPQLRVVWTEGDVVSGAYLQLGFELNNILEETICIEDLSGHESSWLLVNETATVTQPSDNDFLLPNGTSIWDKDLPECKSESMLVPFKKGHLAWAGSQSMNFEEGWGCLEVVDDQLLLPDSINIRKLTKLRVDIEEYDGVQFPIDVLFNSGNDHLKGHASFTHNNEPAYINAEIYRENGRLVIRVNYDITAGTSANELFIRDLVAFS